MSTTPVSGSPIDRNGLIAHISAFLYGYEGARLEEIRGALGQLIDDAGPEAVRTLNRRLAVAGNDWEFYPHDPLTRRIHHLLGERVLEPESVLHGVEHIASAAGGPIVIFSNHLSYSDANLLEVLLHRAQQPMADHLTVIAGPKVYSSLKRRFSSLCFGTIKTPQSSGLSSEDAVMNPREVARAARKSIDAAHDRLRAGDALLVFAEGTRSRSNGMQQLLTGVTRYLELPDTWILPVGLVGSEALFPIGDETVHSVQVVGRVGQPILARELEERSGGDRRVMMDDVGRAIAAQLPAEYRGVYA